MIKGIIIEDEASLRTLIHQFIKEVDNDLHIVAECDNIDDAEKAIDTINPDVIFLDIVLPGGTGLDLLERIPNLRAEVIFLTAYDKYVMDAFKYAAIGYILKPVDKKELKVAIDNAKKRINEKNGNNIETLLGFLKNSSQTESIDKIGVPTPEGITFISHTDIIHCEGMNSCTKIHLNDGEQLVSSYNLAEFKRILPEKSFFQVHKSHIVSLDSVYKYNSKEAIVEMDNGDTIPVSKKMKAEFIQHFKMPKR